MRSSCAAWLSRWVDEEPELEIVAALRNGREALDAARPGQPDVVVLDVEMPELDGISTLPLLLEKKRDLVVIMASTLTRDNAEVSLKALALGAADYIPKPDTEGGIMTSASVPARTDREDPRAWACAATRHAAAALCARASPIRRAALARLRRSAPSNGASRRRRRSSTRIPLRPFSPVPPRILLIGASTGGPQALIEALPQLDAVTESAPVLITQHMPPTFTTILAEHLSRACGRARA